MPHVNPVLERLWTHRDQLPLHLHLAGMEAKDAWRHALEEVGQWIGFLSRPLARSDRRPQT